MKPIDDMKLGSVVVCRPLEDTTTVDTMFGKQETKNEPFTALVLGYDLPYLMVLTQEGKEAFISTHDYHISVLEGDMARACIGNARVKVEGNQECGFTKPAWKTITWCD